MAPILAVAEH